MLFKKSKRRQSASPGRPYSLIGPCLLPPVALIAAPRLPLTTYEPIVLRPITAYGNFARPVSYKGEELLVSAEPPGLGRVSRPDRPDHKYLRPVSYNQQHHQHDDSECDDDDECDNDRGDGSGEREVYDRTDCQQVTVCQQEIVCCEENRSEDSEDECSGRERIDSVKSSNRINYSSAEYPEVRRTDGNRQRRISNGRKRDTDTVILGPPENFRDGMDDDVDASIHSQRSYTNLPADMRVSRGRRGSNGRARNERGERGHSSPSKSRKSGDSEQISMRSGGRSRSPQESYNDDEVEISTNTNRTYLVPESAELNKSGNNPLADTIASSAILSTISRLSQIDDSSEMTSPLELKESELERRMNRDNEQFRLSRETVLLASQQLLKQQLKDKQQQSTKSESSQDVQLSNALKESQDIADRTLKVRDELIECLREQIDRLKEEKSQMIRDFKQLSAAGYLNDQVSRKQPTQDNKEELDTLKSLVVRLNNELDRYQRSFRKLSSAEMEEAPGLPMRGPKPSWLVNTKCLAPLLTAYDDQLLERKAIIEEYEADMDKFRVKFEEILAENERLHIAIEQTDSSGPNSLTEWRSLQKQCKLVLEENQLVMDQLSVQQAKEKALTKSYLVEVSTLRQRTSAAEAECKQCRSELSELQKDYSALKRAHDDSSLEAKLKISPEQHIETLSALKQTLQEEKLKLMSDLSEANANLQLSEAEKKSLTREIEKLKEVIRSREDEIRRNLKQDKKNQCKIELLQLTIDDMEAVATKVNRYLATVLKTADMTAKERDGLVISLKERDKDRLNDLKKMVSETDDIKKLHGKITAYSAKKKQRLQHMSLRLEEQSKDFHLQREEYEREVRYLRQLIRERDQLVNLANGEKQEMLEDLEAMCQVASRDNLRMRDTMVRAARKLHDHASLRACLPPEDIRGTEVDYLQTDIMRDSGVITGGKTLSSDASSRIMVD